MLNLMRLAAPAVQISDGDLVFPLIITISLIVTLALREVLSGLDNPLVRRVRRYLSLVSVPLLVVFVAIAVIRVTTIVSGL